MTDGNFAMLLGYVLRVEEPLAVIAEEGKEAESVQRIARNRLHRVYLSKGRIQSMESS